MRADLEQRTKEQREGLVLLALLVGVMWVVEIFSSLDGNVLDHSSDGIIARNIPHLWGILTSPFIHASFQHLIDNTVPFVFLGVIIALRGAVRLALVTGVIIVLGGIGTWLIAPSGTDTIGASGIVFGYATYLMSRGIFDRKLWELLVGVLVGVVWGGALIASLVPQPNVSWQAHVCGGVAGVIVAWRLSQQDHRRGPQGATVGFKPTLSSRRTSV